MIMMEQYKQETAQIHAPADLIRRTKQAMLIEEQRLQQERAQSEAVAAKTEGAWISMQNESVLTGDQSREQQTYKATRLCTGRIYRWALPVAAAAMVLLLINAASGIVGKRLSKSYSDAPAMEAAMDEAPAEWAEATAEEAASGGMAETEGADAGGMMAGTQESPDKAMPNQNADLYESKQSEAELYDDGTDLTAAQTSAEEAAEACEENSVSEGVMEDIGNDGVEDSAAGVKASDLAVTKVVEVPSFVNDEDTKCVMVNGIRVYVTKATGEQWTAFARVDQVNYMVAGGADVSEAEEFAVEAYEHIIETAENK